MFEPVLRVGLVGCGRIARMFHLPVLHALPHVDLVAIADPDEAARRFALSAAPGASGVASVEDLLAGYEIDAIIVAAPTHLHADVAVAAFDAGRHVYVEKPLAADLADAERIREAWRRSARIGATGFNFRFHPQVRDVRRLVRDGRLGRLTAIRTVFSSSPRDLPGWKQQRRTGGGALVDLASHHLDLIRFLLGDEVAEVVATSASVRHEQDTVLLQLRTTSGIPVQITATQASTQSDRVELLGDTATVTLDRMARRRLHVASVSGPETVPQRVGAATRVISEGAHAVLDGLRPPVETSFARSLAAFAAQARGGSSCGASIEDGYRVAQIVDAAEQSIATGQVATL